MEYLNYLSFNSIVIISYIGICFILLILNKITVGKLNKLFFSTYRSSFLKPLTYIRLIGHIFGHLSWQHFASNFTVILLVGPMIEEKYGSLNLIIMMALCAVITGLLHNLFSRNSSICGASGIAFMMISLSSFVNYNAGKIPFTLVLIFLFYIINEIFSILKKDGISHFGHLLGALCGVIFGIIF